MSKTTAANEFATAGGQQPSRSPELACAADDLKGMLADLTRQFADADHRNTSVLHDMRGRLETMGRGAESVRNQVPAHYASAFARIEDGVQSLAERLAAVGRDREIAKAVEERAQHADEIFQAPVQLSPMAGFQPNLNYVTHPEGVADHSGQAHALAVPAAVANLQGAALDHPAGQSVAGNAAEPWDHDSADALARLYDSGEANFASITPVSHAGDAAAVRTMPPAASDFLHDFSDRAEAHVPEHGDRVWLEQRFAEIATRVEASLVEINPAGAFDLLDQRLEQLETRFGTALQDVATRADVDGLRIVEAHINELSAQFERTQHHLGRLDNIELQLGEVANQLSDERFEKLLGQSAPAGHQGATEQDIEAVAEAVAERVASRMPQPDQRVASIEHGSISDLKRLVEGFVAGQRDTEEHTSTMLDTMQQAMIRMLDRMDAIETAGQSYQGPPASFAPVALPPAPMAPHRVEPVLAVAPVADPMPAPAGRVTAPGTNEDFRAAAVADARRAARKVAAQATGAAALEPELARSRRGAAAGQVAVDTSIKDQKPRSRTPLMVAGIALVAAIGFLAASVGMNKGLPGQSAERRSTEQSSKLTVDNGGAELAEQQSAGTKSGTDSGVIIDSQGRLTPAPSLDASGLLPRAAPAAGPLRPGASAFDPRAARRSDTEPVGANVDDQQGVRTEAGAVHQSASLVTAIDRPAGMSVSPANAVPSGSDLARMRQQRNLASLASQLAAAQATVPSMPASLMPEGANLSPAPTTLSEVPTPSEMPPALIGPNSLRSAAQKGDPSAEFEVAARFAEGRGVTQDFKQAMVWYQRSAQRGFAPAQYRLGTLFERGIGTKAEPARAKIWYGRAAEQGHVKAMHNLAVLNAGRDQSADYATALQWFTAASGHGLADSQYNLGVLYESGLGLERDMKQAYHWLSLAARNGDKEAGRRRDQVRMKLDEADITVLDAAVAAWIAKPSDSSVNDARVAGEAWKSRQSVGR